MISYLINKNGDLMKVTEFPNSVRLIEFLEIKPNYPEIDVHPDDLIIDLAYRSILNLN